MCQVVNNTLWVEHNASLILLSIYRDVYIKHKSKAEQIYSLPYQGFYVFNDTCSHDLMCAWHCVTKAIFALIWDKWLNGPLYSICHCHWTLWRLGHLFSVITRPYDMLTLFVYFMFSQISKQLCWWWTYDWFMLHSIVLLNYKMVSDIKNQYCSFSFFWFS